MSVLSKARQFAAIPEPESARRNFTQAFQVQCRIVFALMVRGALARFGHENLGFFWLLGEPLLMTLGVMAMWTVSGHGHGDGVDLIPFVLTGYTMLTLWRHVVSHAVNSLAHNAGLMLHRNVKLLDISLAESCLESIGGFAAFTVAYIPLYLLDLVPEIHDFLELAGGWLLISWLGFAFSMIVAALSEISPAASKFVPPVMYVSLPATGAFFMVNWMPDKLQSVLLWSPLVHPFEMFRAGLFGPAVHAKYDVWYMILVCSITTVAGLAMLRKVESHLEMH